MSTIRINSRTTVTNVGNNTLLFETYNESFYVTKVMLDTLLDTPPKLSQEPKIQIDATVTKRYGE